MIDQQYNYTVSNEGDIWELFHENSKVGRYDPYLPSEVVVEYMKSMPQTLSFKNLPVVSLPTPKLEPSLSVTKAIQKRSTPNNLQPVEIDLDILSTLLFHSYGITRTTEQTGYIRPFRAVPSGGALYPLELFFHSQHLVGASNGLYHYNPIQHDIRLLSEVDLTSEIGKTFIQPDLVQDTSVHVFFTAIFRRSIFKYGDRGYRFVLLEAGHVAQNFNLVATSLGLATVNIGGFRDREIDELLGIDGLNHSTVYITCAGIPENDIKEQV
ncbi:MAG: SagB/ThcOx family dehydrogenase [Nostoc sp.]